MQDRRLAKYAEASVEMDGRHEGAWTTSGSGEGPYLVGEACGEVGVQGSGAA